jgi:hypothetical protein
MAVRAVNPQEGDDEQVPCGIVPTCPICSGRMEEVYDRYHQKVCVCVDCHTGLTVPGAAWEIARIKRQAKLQSKP